MSGTEICGIVVVSIVGFTSLIICVGIICDAWKHKYIWMYEGHQERDERFEHEREINGSRT